ncbi:MAG TPA: dihydroxyacetone kinase subunit L [Clostridiales bacterium]|nr:dihydroxyacetone kinase subunit L [Clostridiales bacterium]
MQEITIDMLPQLFESVAAVMEEHSERLCEMDAQMGDGDLGLTMKKGFGALPDLLRESDEPDLGKRIAKAGLKMSSVVPSTMGTLMASGLMAAGKSLTGKTAIGPEELAQFLAAFAEGIQKRGKCQPGDRTVLDAIAPAAQAADSAAKQPGASLSSVAQAALQGAAQGVEATRNMTPKFGKAAVFASRAQEMVDQGAVVGQLMILGFVNYISNQ